ncbi:unnamed protein product [Linum trigynum]|uniref:BED-type domain-containing protein n=1 Tax=Linum trigynum TaxID=586398 RepID=A0AAV2CC71_9ROSI
MDPNNSGSGVGSTTGSSPSSPPKKKANSRRTSEVWDDVELFNVVDDDGVLLEKGKCNFCGKIYKAESRLGTSTLKRHIAVCKKLHQPSDLRNESTGPNCITQEGFREKLAICTISHDYVFRCVEHKGNRDVHSYLNGQAKPISRNTHKSDIVKIHERMKEELKSSLQKISSRICLTSDMWTSLTTRGFICLTAHYVDDEWKLNSKLLSFTHLPPPHSSYRVKTTIYRMLREWGIDNKIFSITLDNASNMTNMQNELRDQLNGQNGLLCDGKFFHIRCCGHILNLIVQAGLKVIKDGIRSVRESVKYVEGSEGRKIKFKECVEQSGMKQTRSLWLDVPTRWNSTYNMLERANHYRQAFVNLARMDFEYNECPSSEDWEKIEVLIKFLKPFDEITKLFSGTKYPTSNLFFENVWKIHLELRLLCTSLDDDIRAMANAMMLKFLKYWKDYNLVLAFGVILDPRYKVAFVNYCYEKLGGEYVSKVEDVVDDLELLLEEYKNQSATSATQSGVSMTSPSVPLDNYTAGFYASNINHNTSTSSELQLYLADPLIPAFGDIDGVSKLLPFDVLQYWKDHQFRFPHLSKMAKDVLSIPITSVASESSFSLGGRILTKWRTSILSDTLEAVVTTRNWIRGYQMDDDDEDTRDDGEEVKLLE